MSEIWVMAHGAYSSSVYGPQSGLEYDRLVREAFKGNCSVPDLHLFTRLVPKDTPSPKVRIYVGHLESHASSVAMRPKHEGWILTAAQAAFGRNVVELIPFPYQTSDHDLARQLAGLGQERVANGDELSRRS